MQERVPRLVSEFNEAEAFVGVEPFNDGIDGGPAWGRSFTRAGCRWRTPVVCRGAKIALIINAASFLTSVSSLLPHPACSLYRGNSAIVAPSHLGALSQRKN